MDPLSLIAAGSGVAGLIGGLFGQRTQNRQRQQMIDMASQTLSYLRSQGISNPEQYLQQAILPLLQNSQGVAGTLGPLLGDTSTDWRQMLYDFQRQSVPNLMMPTDMMALYNSPLADSGRNYDDVLGALRQHLYQQAGGGAFQPGIDRATDMASGQDQALAALLERGNNLVDQFGTTGYNLNAQDAAGRGISAGGWDPRSTGMYDAGNSLFSSGGMTPDLSSYSGMAASGIPSLMRLDQGGYSANDLMGPYGQSAASRLLAPQQNQSLNYAFGNNDLTSAFGSGMNLLTNSTLPQRNMQQASLGPIDSGWNQQNGTIASLGAQGLQQLLDRNQELSDIIPYAQQAFSGNLPGEDTYGTMLQNLISQAGSLGGAGVGAGSAGAGYAAGLGPMQGDLEEMLKKGKEFFLKDPLLSQEQMISMAVDQAATQAAHQAEAAQRYAKARGGGAAIVGSGSANRAQADFARQSAELQAQAMRDAALKRQELGLQQQLQGGQIGIAASNADTNRQQAQISANIANANNETSASIANAQAATQAANATAQLRMAALNAGINAATAARGQNYGRSQAGLEALLGVQNTANQRGSVFSPVLIAAMQDAGNRNSTSAQTQLADLVSQRQANLGDVTSQRQSDLGNRQAQLSGISQLLPSLLANDTNRQQVQSQFNNNANTIDTQRMLGLLQASGSAGQGAASTNANMANILATLGLGANNTATNRIGLGLNAMGTAGGLANSNLNSWGQIGNSASADQLSRMGLGSTMLGQNINGRNAAMGMLGNLGTAQNNAVNQTGSMYNTLQQGQAGIWNNLFNMDLQNRQLGMNGYVAGMSGMNNFINALNGGLATSYGPQSSFANGLLGYMGQANGSAAGLAGSLLGGAPQQQNPYSALGAMGQGLASIYQQAQPQQQYNYGGDIPSYNPSQAYTPFSTYTPSPMMSPPSIMTPPFMNYGMGASAPSYLGNSGNPFAQYAGMFPYA